ncbi:MAG: AAA family ATPase [Armatimonadetes bacterium]|nr:AAA family ATPase [Armatimonadota bacterium]
MLPTPIGRQREVLCLPAEGHHVVLGTAGSGKTTLAILRSAYLADPSTDHHGKTLLVTFNRALVTYLKHLQERALDNVTVETYHTFARGYLGHRGKMSYNDICSNPRQRVELIQQAILEVSKNYREHPLFSYPVELFSEEFRWLAQHGISTCAGYEDAERVGRGAARFHKKFRKVVFEIYEKYKELRSAAGWSYDWDDLATAVSDEFNQDNTPRLYKHVVIDEGQDFSPEMIRSLVKAISPNGSLTFFGDVAQQIYGRRMSWRSAGLAVRKIWEFKENYRNTKQIAQLGLAISRMPYFTGTADLVEPVTPTADGPLPTLVHCSSKEAEIELAINQAIQMAKTQSVAILTRDRAAEKTIKSRLPRTAIRLHRDMTTWQAGPGIRYGTYHSAKGLEFDAVILPFCDRETLPDPKEIEAFGWDEATRQDGKLLYVGVTRAKTRLIITYSGEPTNLLPDDANLYERVSR